MDILPSDSSLNGFDSFEARLGDELRGERATMGKSLLDVQRDLHIKAAFISAIENCDITVFPNASFVAGYVRSYAKYLQLDPEVTFQRFCVEAGYVSAGAGLSGTSNKPSVTAAPASNAHGWVPNMPGGGVGQSSGTSIAALAAAGPLLALAVVVVGLGYGVWFVLNDIQRVEFAPIEDSPMVAFEPDALGASASSSVDGFAPSSIDLAADPSILYNRRELEVPLVEPRDGPIFAINPDAPSETIVAEVEIEDVQPVEVAELPIVSETPHVPVVSVVAQQETWIRIYQDNGTIIFEKTLAAGEQYILPDDAPTAYLRAGNATALFVMIDDDAFGPVSTTDAVVRDIALASADVAANMDVVDNPSVALQVAAEAWRETHTAQLD